MATLTDRIDRQIADLQRERERISLSALADLGVVDTKLEALQAAKAVLSRELEQTYGALLKLGLIKEI